MPTTKMPYWIVLAWVTMDGIELTGGYVDRLQQVRAWKAAPLAKALTWRFGDDLTPEDVKKAEAYAASCTEYQVKVCLYDGLEEHPLRRARSEVLEIYYDEVRS